jgi:hypothetical protein
MDKTLLFPLAEEFEQLFLSLVQQHAILPSRMQMTNAVETYTQDHLKRNN